MRLIPTAIILNGDKVVCEEWIGWSKSQLAILERQMSFQKLNEGFRVVKPKPGIVVECWSSFKRTVITITEVHGKKERREDYQFIQEKECYCFPCFTFGIILKIRTEYNTQEYIDGKRYEYDIALCAKTRYVILENFEIKAAGWEEYYEGQYVAVSIDIDEVDSVYPDCCVDNSCIARKLTNVEKVIPECFTIYPVYFIGKMKEWFLKPKRRVTQ